MSDIQNNEIEKLKQKQLINSILNRKNVETEAIIKAAKEMPNSSYKEIEKRRDEIVKNNLKQETIENEAKIKERKKELLDKSVEEELRKWNIEEERKKEKRKRETDKILEELGIYEKPGVYRKRISNREKLERQDRERFRRKTKEKERKKLNLLQQLEMMKRKSGDKVVDKLSTQPKVKNIDENKKEIKISEPQKNIENKRKIISYKIIRGIQMYMNTIEFYERNRNILLNNKVNKANNTETKKKSFKEALRAAIDHKSAISKLEENEKQNVTYRPRTL